MTYKDLPMNTPSTLFGKQTMINNSKDNNSLNSNLQDANKQRTDWKSENWQDDDWQNINWQAPWLLAISPILRDPQSYLPRQSASNTLAARLNALYQHLLNEQSIPPITTGYGKPLRFIAQTTFDQLAAQALSNTEVTDTNLTTTSIPESKPKPRQMPMPMAYESHIANTGEIPTRNNLHDLFNAWIWLTYPKTKAMLNHHQAQKIAQDGVNTSRGKVRDAITVFDENGAILVTCDTNIANALKTFDWQNCLVKPRKHWVNPTKPITVPTPTSTTASESIANNSTSMVLLFGHALIEQLVKPRKPLCAHTFIVKVEASFFTLPLQQQVRQLDVLLAKKMDAWLQQEDVSAKQLSPLPILGVPHFWAANQTPSFYDDAYVFRSGRRTKLKKQIKEEKGE